MVLIGYSHLVSYGNLLFNRTGFPLNLTFWAKKMPMSNVSYICQCKRPDYYLSDFVDFLVFADLDSEVIFTAAALAAGLFEESGFVSCK